MTQVSPHDVMKDLAEQLEDASFPVVICDLELRIQYRNRYVRENTKALGFPGAINAIVTPDQMEGIISRLTAGESLQLDTSVGSLLDTSISMSPLHQDGLVVGVFVTMVPNTGQFNEPSDLASNSSAIFSASFRQPLTDIFASLSVMNRNLQMKGDHSMDEYLSTINQSGYQMLRNTTNIMHRMSSFFPYRAEPVLVDIWERLAEVLEASSIILRQVGIQLEYHLPEDSALVKCDFPSVANAFVNLLSNACRHGSQEGYITVMGKTLGSSVLVSIADRGPGISREYAERVFTSYSSKGKDGIPYAGLGLGLTVARQIIQEAGGTIAINSSPGQGTTVVFSLPTVEQGEPAQRLPMDCGSAAYLRDRFSTVYVGLCDVVPPPEQ